MSTPHRVPSYSSPAESESPPAMVLLVDDQVIIAEAVRRALADAPGIEFHFCVDPAQAVATAEQIAPTVILQDLVMPSVDGLSLVREYRSRPLVHNVPVIVLSTREEAKTKSDAFAAGANDYLVKLPDRIELIARIRYHTRAYMSQQQRDEAYRALRESQRQLMEANLELQRLMNMDGLTGLNNRRRFDEYAQSEWRRAVRESIPLSLLIIDVDDFKRYNDTQGHLAGDQALKSVATAIQSSCSRPADLPARFGGEEFAVVLPGTAAAGAKHVAERILAAIGKLAIAHPASSTGATLTLSVGGVATGPMGSSSVIEFLMEADKALYEAKCLGKNRVIVHDLETR
ncbi:MAG TPA: PleD family two-component system response regulator [Steroidobacteraceae bacterium]|nr:PleD family two-component system response regulator [Steroidobacteraceae bacterium]